MLTIGELSKISQVTIKSIRYYQELGLLEPIKTDPLTNYRYFNKDSYERINSILALKDLGFSLSEIKSILDLCENELELKDYISNKIKEVRIKVKKLKDMETRLIKFNSDLEMKTPHVSYNIIEYELNIPIYASVKINGFYDGIGNGFKSIYKKLGRYIIGFPYSFFYDLEYKNENPNFEAVLELNKKIKNSNFKIGSILKAKAFKLSYKGPYGGQGETYLKLFQYCHENGYQIKLPIIEQYIKGPGMIFKGNTKNYLTECIVLVEK